MALDPLGRPLSEEERQQLAVEAMYGTTPPGADPYAGLVEEQAPLSFSPEDVPAPPPPDPAPQVTPEAPLVADARPVPGAPVAAPAQMPQRETILPNAGQRLGIIGGGIADIMSAVGRHRAGVRAPATNHAGRIRNTVNQDVMMRQARSDRNYQQDVQNMRAERALKLQEGQNARAAALRDPNSPESHASKAMAQRFYKQVGQVIPEDELALITAANLGDYLRVGRPALAAELNRQAAEEAAQRRSQEDERGRKFQAEQSELDRESRMDIARMRERGASSRARYRMAMQQATPQAGDAPVPAEMYSAPPEQIQARMVELQQSLRGAKTSQDRQLISEEIKELREVQHAQIPGYGFRQMPTRDQISKAKEATAAMQALETSVAQAMDLVPRGSSAVTGRIPFTEDHENYENFKSALSDVETHHRVLKNLGVPSGPDALITRVAAGNPDDVWNQLQGISPDLMQASLDRQREQFMTKMEKGWGYNRLGEGDQQAGPEDEQGTPPDDTQATTSDMPGTSGESMLSPEKRSRLEELRAKYGGGQ